MKTNEKCNSKEDVEKYITEIEVAISEKRIGEAFDRIADLDNCWLRYLPDYLDPLESEALKEKLQEIIIKSSKYTTKPRGIKISLVSFLSLDNLIYVNNKFKF